VRLRLVTELDDAGLLEAVAKKLQEVYGLEVEVRPIKHTSAAAAYDPIRGQYNAATLLRLLDVSGEYTLLLTDKDLFYPGLNFVFGYAPGRKGVVSIHRLSFGVSFEKLVERAVKECVHEVGHMLGLAHCTTLGCVMNFSSTVSDVDRKSSSPCPTCLKKSRLKPVTS